MKRGVVRLSNDLELHMLRQTRYNCNGETDRDLQGVVTYERIAEPARGHGSDVPCMLWSGSVNTII